MAKELLKEDKGQINGLLAIDLSAALVKRIDKIRWLAASGLGFKSSVVDKDAVLMDIVNLIDSKIGEDKGGGSALTEA
jgi:hypothetical protein